MREYKVYYKGHLLWTGTADTSVDALDALARDIGYADLHDMLVESLDPMSDMDLTEADLEAEALHYTVE